MIGRSWMDATATGLPEASITYRSGVQPRPRLSSPQACDWNASPQSLRTARSSQADGSQSVASTILTDTPESAAPPRLVDRLKYSSVERHRHGPAPGRLSHPAALVCRRPRPRRSNPSEAHDRGAVATFAASARPPGANERMVRNVIPHGIAKCPGTHPMDDRGLAQPGQGRIVEVAVQHLEGLTDRGTAQVERRGHSAGPFQLQARG